ncbi:MAG: HAD-IIA family hydrolase [Anaerolineaceae bacterium]|nr:HAD-IIA family hydrolase [Anaerolineaceae bacterium]
MKNDNKLTVSALLLDMDGTFFLGESLLPGALELLDFLNEKGLPFSFLTNNSSKNRSAYVEKLTALGVRQEDARIYTAGDATIAYLKQHFAGQRICLLGTKSLRASFLEAGLHVVEEEPEVMVLGYDTEMTYAELARFCLQLQKGLPFVATHPDINCPSPIGQLPDIGAFFALIEVSTGRKPDVVIGKPNRGLVDALAQKWGLRNENILMIGDRLYTDIALGSTAGVQTCLVLSGESKLEDIPGSHYQPDFVCENLADLKKLLSQLSFAHSRTGGE